jgi:4-amino-4-deoxychorismate lyase
MPIRALAVLGQGLVPVDTPIARADDAGLNRGDGVFESLHVRDGRPWQLEPHLARMAGSAALLKLPLPDGATLAALAEVALTGAPASAEAVLKLVCTRGPDSRPDSPTVWAAVSDVSAIQLSQRRDGVAVRTATLGIAADVRSQAPWLLGGAKTLSYAVNMAALRWAAGLGADDVILLASDGSVLEAPTATVVWAVGELLCTIPAETGILAGTTAGYLLDHAADLGLKAEHRTASVDDLRSADEVWLCSSVRGVARVVSIDRALLGPSQRTAAIQELLGFPLS